MEILAVTPEVTGGADPLPVSTTVRARVLNTHPSRTVLRAEIRLVNESDLGDVECGDYFISSCDDSRPEWIDEHGSMAPAGLPPGYVTEVEFEFSMPGEHLVFSSDAADYRIQEDRIIWLDESSG